MRRKITDDALVQKWLNTKSSAKDRGYEFTLSLSRLRVLMKTSKCFYTGMELSDTENHPTKLTLDRIDNTKGYTDDNVVACSLRINAAKGALLLKDISDINKAINKRYGK